MLYGLFLLSFFLTGFELQTVPTKSDGADVVNQAEIEIEEEEDAVHVEQPQPSTSRLNDNPAYVSDNDERAVSV